MDATVVSGLLQSGAIGVLAYLLIQQLGEQVKAQREEMRALIEQLGEQSRTQREEMKSLIVQLSVGQQQREQQILSQTQAMTETIRALEETVRDMLSNCKR